MSLIIANMNAGGQKIFIFLKLTEPHMLFYKHAAFAEIIK